MLVVLWCEANISCWCCCCHAGPKRDGRWDFFPFLTKLKTLLDDIVYKVWSSQFGVESQWSTSTEHQYINKHWIIQWKKNSGRVDQNNMTWRGRKRVAGLIRFWNWHPILWNIIQTWPKFMRVFVSEENVHIVLYQVSPCGFPWKLGQEARCQSNCRCAWNAKHIANAGFYSTFFSVGFLFSESAVCF